MNALSCVLLSFVIVTHLCYKFLNTDIENEIEDKSDINLSLILFFSLYFPYLLIQANFFLKLSRFLIFENEKKNKNDIWPNLKKIHLDHIFASPLKRQVGYINQNNQQFIYIKKMNDLPSKLKIVKHVKWKQFDKVERRRTIYTF